jgi:SAM-dependent methyltransferase
MAHAKLVPRRLCAACGKWTVGTFRTGPGGRPDARCPHCKSLERQRFLAVLTSFLTPAVEPVGTLLDIAPAPCTTAVLGELAPQRHIRMDIGYDGRGVDLLGSVTAIPLPDRSVDVLVCYHVLEHVGDDAAAMRELERVLAPGGVGLVQVPIKFGCPTDEDPSAPEDERVRRFGQADHVRYYGDDFEKRLVDAGLVCTRISPRTLVGEKVCQVLGLIPDEYVWVVHGNATTATMPVVPPPTGLTRTLDAVVDAWASDLGKLDQARDRVRRLKARTSRQAQRIGQLRGRVARLRTRVEELSPSGSLPRRLGHRLGHSIGHRIGHRNGQRA